jgi:hypothetical protein
LAIQPGGALEVMRRRAAAVHTYKHPFDQQGAGQHGSDTQDEFGYGLCPAFPLAEQEVDALIHLWRSTAAGTQQLDTGLQQSGQVLDLFDEAGNALWFRLDDRFLLCLRFELVNEQFAHLLVTESGNDGVDLFGVQVLRQRNILCALCIRLPLAGFGLHGILAPGR